MIPYEGCDEFKVGDTVACRKGHNLELGHDGLSRPREEQVNRTYPYGICVSVEPFVIISADGLGIWKEKHAHHYYALNEVHSENRQTALKTWEMLNNG